jgi:hypothetical protein
VEQKKTNLPSHDTKGVTKQLSFSYAFTLLPRFDFSILHPPRFTQQPLQEINIDAVVHGFFFGLRRSFFTENEALLARLTLETRA